MENSTLSLSCCFTGHRNVSEDIEHIATLTEQAVISLIQKNFTDFYCGGALGFDNLCASIIISLKSLHPQIKLNLILPCEKHYSYWTQSEIDQFQYILNNADLIHYIKESYETGCTWERNRFMVDNSNICVSYLRRNTGGTAYTVDYAKKQNKPILKI